ncbi:hypothetical protein PR048_008191 [Dryococelus australis]|uniref:Uncharacterized protein n=1 Tax=Dryococelus australis TaxID=614101 RepID=A0ABQ9HX80_9NEOP|nr:hypothetical protein PR048_008191 [Dryococelus australis]
MLPSPARSHQSSRPSRTFGTSLDGNFDQRKLWRISRNDEGDWQVFLVIQRAKAVTGSAERATGAPEVTGSAERAIGVPEKATGVPEVTGSSERATGVPDVTCSAERATGLPEVTCSVERATGVPEMTDSAERATGVPDVTCSAERATGLPEVTCSVERATGVPEMTDSAERATGIPEVTGSAERAIGVPEKATGVPEVTGSSERATGVPDVTCSAERATGLPEVTCSVERATGVPEMTDSAERATGVPDVTCSAERATGLPEVTCSVERATGVPEMTDSAERATGIPEVTGSAERAIGVPEKATGLPEVTCSVERATGVPEMTDSAERATGVPEVMQRGENHRCTGSDWQRGESNPCTGTPQRRGGVGEPGSISGRVAPGYSHMRTVTDYATGRRVFSGMYSPPPGRIFIPALLHTSSRFTPIGSQDLGVKSRPIPFIHLHLHAPFHAFQGGTRFGRLLAAKSSEPMRVIDVSMEQRRNEGEAGDPLENPPTNGIVRHDSQMRKSPRITLVGGERTNRSATVAPFTFKYKSLSIRVPQLPQSSATSGQLDGRMRCGVRRPLGMSHKLSTNGHVWAAFNNGILKADKVEARWIYSRAGIQEPGKRDIPDKTRRQAASAGTFPTCANL